MQLVNRVRNFLIDDDYYIDLYENFIHVFSYEDILQLRENEVVLQMNSFQLVLGKSFFSEKTGEERVVITRGFRRVEDDSMRHLIWVEITCDQPELVLKKIYSLSIDVFQVIYLSRGLRLKILAADEDKISKLIFYRVRKIRDAGIFFLPSYLHKKWLWMVGILCFLFLVFFFQSFYD